jgi:hypothetical protein
MFAKTPTYIKLPQSLEAKVAFIAVLHDLHPLLRWGNGMSLGSDCYRDLLQGWSILDVRKGKFVWLSILTDLGVVIDWQDVVREAESYNET